MIAVFISSIIKITIKMGHNTNVLLLYRNRFLCVLWLIKFSLLSNINSKNKNLIVKK